MKNISPLQKKLEKLEAQKVKIQQELDTLTKQRNERIIEVLSYLPPNTLSLHTIIGGLVSVCKDAQGDSQKAEAWQEAGKKFCNAKKSERPSLLKP